MIPRRLQPVCPAASAAALAVLLLFTACTPLGRFPESHIRPEIRYWTAPTVLPQVTPEMKTKGFWIARTQDPDRLLMDDAGIRALNRDIRDRLGLVKEIALLPDTFDAREVRLDLTRWLIRFRDGGRFFEADGRQACRAFFDALERRMNLSAIASRVPVRFGMITANTDQRLLPVSEALFAEPGDIDFDRLQNNALDPGTPVAVLHQSAEGRWLYTLGPSSNGWVPAESIALCPRKTLTQLDNAPYVTVVRAKGSLYRDAPLTRYAGFARMGARFAIQGAPAPSGPAGVLLPARQADGSLALEAAYLDSRDVVTGHLAYTPRHILDQAFEMLNAPYGWGGSSGEQDCSQFIQEVFACVGLRLPRNSAAQARVGRDGMILADDAPEDIRRAGVTSTGLPGACLLYMKGHVMLYLGAVDERPYAIHDIWGYHAPQSRGGEIRVINRVAVTDLTLGIGSAKGSLLKRLQAVRQILAPRFPRKEIP